jgi:hypothetical protein
VLVPFFWADRRSGGLGLRQELIPWSSLQQHVRLAYQPPASSTFLSEQTSHQQSASSTFLSEQISTSHQPPAKRTGCKIVALSDELSAVSSLVFCHGT